MKAEAEKDAKFRAEESHKLALAAEKLANEKKALEAEAKHKAEAFEAEAKNRANLLNA